MSSSVTVVGEGNRRRLLKFDGDHNLVDLVDGLCRRPRFGDEPARSGSGRRDRALRRGLPMVCLIRSAEHADLVDGLARRLAEASPRRVPHCQLRLPSDPVPAGGTAEVQRIREILAHAAQVLGSSRNAAGGRIRFRRFILLDWLMSLKLDESSDGVRRGAQLRKQLRKQDFAQRFDDAISSVGGDISDSGWWKFATLLVRLLPPLLFLLRVSGRVPLVGAQYRWFLRQPHLTPEVPGGFLGFAERLTDGEDGWQQENATQLSRLLTNAFLEDLRRAWRSPWRLGGPRRMTYAALLLDEATADNGGFALLRLINHVRTEVGQFDPLLVISAGAQRPLPQDTAREILPAKDADYAYVDWLSALPDARRARTDTAWYLRLTIPDSVARAGEPLPPVPGLGTYAVARPPWWGRRIVPVGLVIVVLAGLVTGYVTWSQRNCENGLRPPAGGSTLESVAGQCIGVTDGHYTFDPSLSGVTQRILTQNEQADQVYGADPNRTYITVVDLQALTPTPDVTDSLAAERDSLEGVAVAQAQSLGDPAVPLLRVLIGNGGTDMAYGTTVAAQLRALATPNAPLAGVIGLDHSTQGVDDTVLALAIDGLPTIGASLSEDQLADSNPLYYQVSPQNRREAMVAAAFAALERTNGAIDDEVEVVYPDDPDDTYAQNLTADVQASFAASGFHVTLIQFAPSTTPADQVRTGTLYPDQDGKNICESGFRGLVYYAGDGVPDFNAFLDGVKECGAPPVLLADDDVSRFVADTTAVAADQSVPFYYTSFAVAPTSTPQGPASDFYDGPVGLDALFPQNKNDNAGPSLDGHAALSFDATQVLVAAVQHLRLGNASIPITPGDVWREVSTIRGSSPATPSQPHPNNDALEGVTGVIDFSATGSSLHYPANKQVAILRVQQGGVATNLAFFCGAPTDPRQSPHCPIDVGSG